MKNGADELNIFTDTLLDMGETMLSCGGEIARVEDTISRMGRAYGARSTNVFAITSSIVLTVMFADGTSVTQTRRILNSASTDFDKLIRLNALSRKCAEEPIALEKLRLEIDEIRSSSPSALKLYTGSALSSGAFAMLFGGGGIDFVFSALFGLFVCFMKEHFAPKCPNMLFFCFVCSLAVGMGICGTAFVFPIIHIDKVMIGDIMLLIPGINITNAVRDMMIGNTISGIMKFTESLLWTGAMVLGFMIAVGIGG